MMRVLVIALLATSLIAPFAFATGSDPSEEKIGGDRIFIIDGDTVALPCKPETGFVRGCAEKVRLKDIDTPEVSHPTCSNELIKGLEAKARLRELLSGAVISIKRSGEIDRYGRSLGWLVLSDGSDIGSILMQEKLALHWSAGSRAKAARISHWCRVSAQ